MSLLLTGAFGFTVLIGMFIVLFKNNKKIVEFSISIAFSVLLFLVFLELIPETLEHLNYMNLILFTLAGMIILKLLDMFIPEHDHSNKKSHVFHIGIISAIALMIHNIIEGIALYTTINNDLTLGIMLGLGIGLHNIPMGMIIGSILKNSGYSNLKIILSGAVISLSTLAGALVIYFIGNISNYVLGILLAITLGMIIYIVFFELLDHLKHQNKKTNIIGFVVGTLLFMISLLFHSH